MIVNAFLWIISLLLSFIIGLLQHLGTVSASPNIVSAVTTASGYITALNDFFPNTTILAATSVLFVFEIAYMGYKLIRWGYQKIPGIN